MRAAVLTDLQTVDVRDVPDAEPAADEVLIRVEASGICGSDLHAWHGRHPFRRPPVVLGHEPSGTIVSVGDAVTDAFVGDRVVIEPQRVCGQCAACRRGDPQVCERKQYPATQDWTGALAEYFAAPAAMTHRVPDHVPLDIAALAEPLAVACHAHRRVGTESGYKVNIIGSGSIGLLSQLVARATGAEVDVVTDVDPRKLTVAGEMGAGRPTDVRDDDALVRLGVDGSVLADVTVVAATAPTSLTDAASLTRPGGTILLLGLYADTATFAASRLVTSEQRIIGSVTYASQDFERALELLADDTETFARFVTRRIGLDEVGDEFARQASGGETLKTLVQPGGPA